MKTYQHILRSIIVAAAVCFGACSQPEFDLPAGGGDVAVTFHPTMSRGMDTRVIGDAEDIDKLDIVVYEGVSTLTKKFSLTEDWIIAKRDGISLTLIEGHTYNILFWAHDSSNTAYTITDNGTIEIDYADYLNGGFSRMEQLDAFCGVSTITVGAQKTESKGVELSRPLAQLNFADKASPAVEGTHKALVTFHSIPTSFNPFTGAVALTDAADAADDVTFTFTDFPDDEFLGVGGASYYYIACNYLFAPTSGTTSVAVTLDLQKMDGTSLNKFEFKGAKEIVLEKNKKTNAYGTIVESPSAWSIWDGTFPASSTLITDTSGRIVVDEAADLAWLSKNGASVAAGSTFVQSVDIDMGGKNIDPIQLPAGVTYDGGDKQIVGYANSLFGDATSLSVKNLTVSGSEVSAVSHVGTLINTLKGSATFQNITVLDSSVSTANGAAGGIVGYVVRTSQNDRSESLAVVFDDCHVSEVDVAGHICEGHFVGLLRGYDNGESLTFNDNCTLDAVVMRSSSLDSPYREGNEGAWLAANDYTKFNGWLGDEECYRGKVYYGANRFIPRWDGTTTNIVPLKADPAFDGDVTTGDTRYMIYSAFDLVGVRVGQGKNAPAALYFKENVDMNGQGPDGKFYVHPNFTKSAADLAYSTTDDDYHFKSFDYVYYLEGNNHSIYNLSIYSAFNGNGVHYAAFVTYANGDTTHQNITLRNCCTVVPHVVKKNSDGDDEDKSYGAAFCCNNDSATLTMKNVHAYDCKVFALQKVGTLVGRLGPNTSGVVDNCTVNRCYIENYNCQEHQEPFGGGVTWFYTPGEVGGMFGFVEDNVTISNCHVKETTIYAYGQNDKTVLLFLKIPGRHVSTFIGDIRTSENTDGSKDNIVIKNCTVDSATKSNVRHDKHSSTYPYIGKAYYVSLAGDKKGVVTVDGKSLL